MTLMIEERAFFTILFIDRLVRVLPAFLRVARSQVLLIEKSENWKISVIVFVDGYLVKSVHESIDLVLPNPVTRDFVPRDHAAQDSPLAVNHHEGLRNFHPRFLLRVFIDPMQAVLSKHIQH